MTSRPDAIAYVDGMNLYYGAVKYRPQYKWLDVQSLLESMFPQFTIIQIRYYTARLTQRFPKDKSPFRQLVYLDALETRNKIEIRWGTYADHDALRRIYDTDGFGSPGLFRPRLQPEAAHTVDHILSHLQSQQPPDRPYVLVRIHKSEEKGSDVNLATDLIMDTQVHQSCDTAIIVTNDSDFIYPLSIVAQSPTNVILVNPSIGRNRTAKGLSTLQNITRQSLRTKFLKNNQLPNPVTTPDNRKLYKPQAWNKKPST